MFESESYLHINIANIIVRLESAHQGIKLVLEEPYYRFISNEQSDVVLRWHRDFLPELECIEEIFDSESFWKLQSSKDYYIFNYPSLHLPNKSFKILLLTKDFSRGDIYQDPDSLPEGKKVNPFTDRLDELLYMHLLSQGRGVILHACCVAINGKGLLFLGHSGAGKSTMADLWKAYVPDAKILTDDRAIVRFIDGKYLAYGTPWHGSAECALPNEIPLTEIYIIEHSNTNFFQPLEGALKVAEIMTRSLTPYWLRDATEFSLDFISHMAQGVPCQRLGFKPSKEIINLVNLKHE